MRFDRNRTTLWMALAMTLITMPDGLLSAPKLPACPSSPNCVSSQAADAHFIEPFTFSDNAAGAFARLRDLLSRRGDTRLVAATDRELRVEFRTTLGFVDDALFLLDTEQGVIQLRSAARTGYWDLGKNRRRLEEIRRELSEGAGK